MNFLIALALMAGITPVIPAEAAQDSAAERSQKMERKTEHYFDKMDTDNNGLISRAESDAFAERMFKEADADNNGSITQAELKAHKERKMEQYKDMQPSSGR